MNTCREHRRAALEVGSPHPAGAGKEHTAVCDKCGKDDEDLRTILAGAEAMRDELGSAMQGVDWDGLSERIADRAVSEARVRKAEPSRVPQRGWRWSPLLTGAAAGLVVGVLATFLYLRRGPVPLTGPGAAPVAASAEAYAASGDFLQRVELEMAKRATIDYLEKSEYMLLDLLEPRPATGAGAAAVAAAAAEGGASAERARALLAKKRFFNANLDDIRMAKARALCDQIEILFLELSQLQTELDPKQAAELRKYVEDKQLLLQIRLLKKELRGNEA
jgi:hypothetical protein